MQRYARVLIAPLASVTLPVVLAFALAGSGCCTDPVNGSRYFCLGDMSDREEGDLGAEYAPSFIAESGGRYPDEEMHAYLNDIVVNRMAKQSQRPNLPWTFEILNTSDVNAFALPGGKVFVTRGMLALVDTEAQFAHLMGHEVGHVCHRHAMQGQGRSVISGILTGLVGLVETSLPTTSPDDPLWITGTAGALATLTTLKFSRDQELEADARGVDYALRAGYDPREAKKTFQTFLELKRAAGASENRATNLLSTHPLDEERIRRLDRYIAGEYPDVGSNRNLAISQPAWNAQREKIRVAQASYKQYEEGLALIARAAKEKRAQLLDDAEIKIREGAKAQPRHAPFEVGLALVSFGRNSNADALRHLDRAVEFDPDNFEAHFLRSFVHRKEKRLPQAQSDMKAAHALFPASPLPCYVLGVIHSDMGDANGAASWYEKAIDLAPRGSDVRAQARARLDAINAARRAA